MTTDFRTSDHSSACARFDAQLGAWLEHDLDRVEHGWMTAHRATCAACDAMVRELEAIVTEASALPLVTPSRDLWSGIEARLAAPVIPLPTAAATESRGARTPRSVSVRWFAVAATLLVAVSSGVTWRLAVGRNSGDARVDSARGGNAPAAVEIASGTAGMNDSATSQGLVAGTSADEARTTPVTDRVSPATANGRVRLVRASDEEFDLADPNVTYEREIVALRRIVDERFTELDSGTVAELRRNLDIIDRAISDSRAALARDPRNGVVSSQLDRTLQAKLDLLRRVALL
jgi:hypothetical protein